MQSKSELQYSIKNLPCELKLMIVDRLMETLSVRALVQLVVEWKLSDEESGSGKNVDYISLKSQRVLNKRYEDFLEAILNEVAGLGHLKLPALLRYWADERGSLFAISGSIMQRLTDISPTFSTAYWFFLESDIDIYCRGIGFFLLGNVFRQNGYEIMEDVFGRYPHKTRKIKIPVISRFHVCGGRYFYLNLINIGDQTFEEAIGNFDLEYLACFFSNGAFQVVYPGAFITGLPSLCTPLNNSRRAKYKVRKFPTPTMWDDGHVFPHILSATLRSTKMLKFIVSKPLESEWQVKGKTQIMRNASHKRIKTETGKVSLGEVTLDCKRVKLILRATPLSRGPVFFMQNFHKYVLMKEKILLLYSQITEENGRMEELD